MSNTDSRATGTTLIRTRSGRLRIVSQPDPDRLELGCDRIWDEIEVILKRHGELMSLAESRTARETTEMAELWQRYLTMRAYSNYYREIVLRDAQRRAGAPVVPRVLAPRVR